MSNFRVGQKVVCIIHFKDKVHEWEVLPEKGGIYTIRAISTKYGQFLRFEEIRNRPFAYADGFGEVDFWGEGFRPLVTRKTDISIFKRILNDADKRIEENV